MKVSVLIGSRNRPQMLIRCLESVLSQDYPVLEVIVLDDASESMELCPFLASRFPDPRLRCIRSEKNLGVAAGRNRLMEEASGDILCVIDDDAYFDNERAISYLVETFASNPQVGIVASKVIDHRGERDDLLVPFSRYWRLKRPGLTEARQFVSYFLGGCHAIRREVISVCGVYQSDLMFGEEELDLSYRAIAAGYRIIYEPRIVVHHRPQPSVVGKAGQGSKAELYYHVRNRLFLAYKYLPWKYVPTYLMVWLGKYAIDALLLGAVGSYLKGLTDGLRWLSEVKRTPLDAGAVEYLKRHFGRLWF